MKAKYILLFSSCAVLLTCCNQNTKPKTSDVNWYLTGYGSFMKGENFSNAGGVKFIKGEDGSYTIKDLELGLSDTFQISSEKKEYIANNEINLQSTAFTTKNMMKDTITADGRVSVLMPGKYNIDLKSDGQTYTVDISNATGTKANDHLAYSTKTESIDFFAEGDHHGTVDETEGTWGNVYPYIENYIAYVKDEANKTPNKDIFISHGDLWQGTYKSNVNKGAMLNEIYAKAGFNTMTIGNHEFDWGQQYIAQNSGATSMRFLGANIVDRTSKKIKDFVQPYYVTEVDGIRVGIIGTIGSTQITSITSSNVQDIEFSDPCETFKKYSDVLRNRYRCELVVGSFHQGSSDVSRYLSSLVATSPNSGKRYVDGVFTAHDHSPAATTYSGVGLLNSGSNGINVSHLTLEYSPSTVTSTLVENLHNGNEGIAAYSKKDSDTTAIINKYITREIEQRCHAVAGTTDYTFSKSNQAPDFMAKAMYEYAHAQGHDVVLAIVNNGRNNLPQGDVSFTNLFDTFPFTNYTVIMDAMGSDLLSAGPSNYYYSANPFTISSSKKYKIAVYDYLAFHQNSRREYDYFSSSAPFNIYAQLDKMPVDIIFDAMKSISGTIKANDYDRSRVSNFNFI